VSRNETGRFWLLRGGPDALALLAEQAQQTVAGVDAFAAWAAGDQGREEEIREAEHACDHLRRSVLDAVRDAFSTPVWPEDLFELSQALDRVINGAKDTVREAESMGVRPDAAVGEMIVLVSAGTLSPAEAITALAQGGSCKTDPTQSAEVDVGRVRCAPAGPG
jgi:uncharacterized protein